MNDTLYVKRCLQYVSVPLQFCGNVGSNIKFNEGSWKWEYCVPKKNPADMTGASALFSVFRCAQLQVPDPSNTVSEVCKCISDNLAIMRPIGSNYNGCECVGTNKRIDANIYPLSVFNAASTEYYYLTSGGTGGFVFDIYDLASAKSTTGAASNGPSAGVVAVFPGRYASGLPYNYNVGSGRPLNQEDDPTKPGTPLIPAFIGGRCINAPSCGANTLSLCDNATDCLTLTSGLGVWDAIASRCIDDLTTKCVAGFGHSTYGSNRGYCRDKAGKCNAELDGFAFDVCTNQASCINIGGWWDKYLLQNQCVEASNKCVGGVKNASYFDASYINYLNGGTSPNVQLVLPSIPGLTGPGVGPSGFTNASNPPQAAGGGTCGSL